MKTCSRCKKEKPYSEFYTRNIEKDGLDYYCKDCRLENTAISRRKRELNGPPCSNCGDTHVYYACGLCKTCYTYKCRTGVDRPTQDDHDKVFMDWTFKIMNGHTTNDIAKEYDVCETTVRAALMGRSESDKYNHARELLPRKVRQKIKSKITGRLASEDVRRIRSMYKNGAKLHEIGEEYGRCISSISRIVNGSRYSDVV